MILKRVGIAAALAMAASLATADGVKEPFDLAKTVYFTGGLGVAGNPSALVASDMIDKLYNEGSSELEDYLEADRSNRSIEAVGLAGQLAIGFQLNPHFALEFGGYSFNQVRMFESMPTRELEKEVDNILGNEYPEMGWGGTAVALVDFLPQPQFGLYVKGGGHVFSSPRVERGQAETGLGWIAGVGAEFMYTEHFGIRIDADARRFSHDTALYAGLGLIWRNDPVILNRTIIEEREVERVVEVEVERIVEIETIIEVPVYAQEVCRELGSSLEGVNFETNSADLTQGGRARLDQSVRILRQNPDLTVLVAAHTDNVGAADYNLALSERRAASVMAYLIDSGIAPRRLTSRGYGLSDPIADNRTPAGRALNRRVELRPDQEIICE